MSQPDNLTQQHLDAIKASLDAYQEALAAGEIPKYYLAENVKDLAASLEICERLGREG